MADNEKSKQSSSPKLSDNKGQVREGHRIDGGIPIPKAWQPTIDRTTTPPPAKNDGDKK